MRSTPSKPWNYFWSSCVHHHIWLFYHWIQILNIAQSFLAISWIVKKKNRPCLYSLWTSLSASKVIWCAVTWDSNCFSFITVLLPYWRKATGLQRDSIIWHRMRKESLELNGDSYGKKMEAKMDCKKIAAKMKIFYMEKKKSRKKCYVA